MKTLDELIREGRSAGGDGRPTGLVFTRSLSLVEHDMLRRYLAGQYGIRLPWRVRLGMWWRWLLDKHGRGVTHGKGKWR